jgi:hypothetical protein
MFRNRKTLAARKRLRYILATAAAAGPVGYGA